jgi:myosin-5
LQLPTD